MGDEVDEKTIVSYQRQLAKYLSELDCNTTKVIATIMRVLRFYDNNTKKILDKRLQDATNKIGNICKYLNNTQKHIKKQQEELQ